MNTNARTATPTGLTPATAAPSGGAPTGGAPAPGITSLGTESELTPSRGASLPVASGAVALRTLKKFVRTPQLVVAGTLSGAMFLLIFRYVFGGAVSHLGTMSYVDFVIPGFVVTSVLFTGMGAAAGVAEDLSGGSSTDSAACRSPLWPSSAGGSWPTPP
jgi:hypothetical protein